MRRVNAKDLVYRTDKEKWDAVVNEIEEVHNTGRPILIGTTDVAKSEKLSGMLKRRGIKHELLNAKPENVAREAEIVAQAGRIKSVTISTNMAGRGTDIILGGNPDMLAKLEFKEQGKDPDADKEEFEKVLVIKPDHARAKEQLERCMSILQSRQKQALEARQKDAIAPFEASTRNDGNSPRSKVAARNKFLADDLDISEGEVDALIRIGDRDLSLSEHLSGHGDEDGPELGDLSLVSILYDTRTPAQSAAVLRERVTNRRYTVKPGDRLGRMRIGEIRPKDVTFIIDDFGTERQETLTLRKQEVENQ